MASIGTKLKHAWNLFNDVEDKRTDDYSPYVPDYGSSSSYFYRPERIKLNISNEKSIISSIYTRMSMDVADIDIRHVRLDDQNRYLDDMDSGLNECLRIQANIDQAARAFRQDIVMTLFDKGVAAIVPVDATLNPTSTGGFDVKTLRVGNITQWHPKHVTVDLYNEKTGIRQEVTLPKSFVAIVENPLYAVMNEPSSTLQRLVRKLGLLDSVDEQTSSGKLDLIIQLPYVIKTDARRQQAENRRKDIEVQLKGSKYGIAYTDGTEKITQLNRPAENNLLAQIEVLQANLYTQLGLTAEIMNGTATETAMLNYNNRTVKPVVDAIVEGMKRTFLTKTARSQKQSIMAFRDPFKLVPVGTIAEIADKFTRNEITTANEIRSAIGMIPAKDPKADQLVNSNMPQPTPPEPAPPEPDPSGVDTTQDLASTPIGDISQNGT